MKRKALYLDDSEKELDALLENEDFWKPGKSEWGSEILDITNKQRDLPEMGGSFLHAKKESGASPLSFGNP